MTKRVAIIGKGTAGVLSAAHFSNIPEKCEVDWYFDTSIKPQAVGEGSTLDLPRVLMSDLNFEHSDLSKIDGTIKTGLEKEGWGTGELFYHNFSGSSIAYHFNAIMLQNYILEKIKSKNNVKIIEQNTTADQVDADFVMDCSGTPKSFDDYNKSDYIPVNSVYVTQCFWYLPKFQHTKTIAKKHGWVFGIPLQNRCSIGYLYNNQISTLEEVKEDVQELFERFNLTPSDTTNNFSFNNYYKKLNYTNRISYNGNASFFLEPIEATSISTMLSIIEDSRRAWFNNTSINECNDNYLNLIYNTQIIIMLHYAASSKYNTPFWDYATDRGVRCLQEINNNNATNKLFKILLDVNSSTDSDTIYKKLLYIDKNSSNVFNQYQLRTPFSFLSYYKNVDGLKMFDKLRDIVK